MSLKSRLQKLEQQAPKFRSEKEAIKHFFTLYPEKNQLRYAFDLHIFLKEEGFSQAPFEKIVGCANEKSTKQNPKKDSENGVDVLSQPIKIICYDKA